MDWRTAGEDAYITIDVMVDGEFAAPDAGSIKFQLRGNDGGVISGYDQIPLPDTTLASISYTLPASVNGIGSSEFETRYAIFEYKISGVRYLQQYIYRLIPFLPIQTTPSDVRNLLGVSERELPDQDVELIESYLLLFNEYGADFKTALLSGTIKAIHASRSIGIRAALTLIPSLPARVKQREQFSNAEMERGKMDFQKLEATLEQLLSENLTAALSLEGSVLPTILAVVSPTDVITGA